MALSYVSYTGDGATKNFAVPFGYIAETDVAVKVDGVAVTFTWVNAGLIQTTVAPANGTVVDVRRSTPNTALLVDFEDASTLTESDLDTFSSQILYIAQETLDRLVGVISLNDLNQFDANNKRIVNLADPVNPQDAVTMAWAMTSATSSLAQAIAARDAALIAQAAAEAAQAVAQAQATLSGTSAANAATSASNADADRIAAEAAAATATTQAGIATTKAGEASTSAATALTHLNDFKGRWYGAFATAPTLDPLGNPLGDGDVYYDTTLGVLRVYGGATWSTLTQSTGSGTSDVIHIKSYGAVGDGVTDDTVALQAWLAAINASTKPNVTASLGNGTYCLNSASAAGGLTITRNNVTIDGAGGGIKVTGTSVVSAVFNSDGKSNLTYRSIRFIGNSQANAFANGIAVSFGAYTAGSCSGFLVENCYFENFKGDYWVFAENYQTRVISNVVIRNNKAVSMPGNARGPAVITIASSFCAVMGSGDANFPLTEVLIENNLVYADYIKNGVIVMSNVQNFTIQNNTIWNAGQEGISNDCGAYGIQIYANTPFTPGKYGRTTGNKIFSPRSIGIYQAHIWPGSIIANNLIVSQGPDTLNSTLPKGGICLNGSCETTVTGNIILATTMDAIFCNTSPQAHTGLNITNNTIRGASRGIVFESATYNGSNIVIQDNLIRDVGTKGIICRSYTGSSTSDIVIRNNQIHLSTASSVGIEFDSPTSTYQLFYMNIHNNTIRGLSVAGLIGVKFNNFVNTGSFLRSNVVFGQTFTAPYQTTGTTLLVATDNVSQV